MTVLRRVEVLQGSARSFQQARPKWLAVGLALLWTVAIHAAQGEVVLDDFAYPTSTAARSTWIATAGPQVSMVSTGAWGSGPLMTLPCDFATRASRCYWDRTAMFKLGAYTDFEFEVYAPDPGAISAFTLYFKSGGGWYGASAMLQQTGWQKVRFRKSAFIAEGNPSGWDSISGIRLSPWKGASRTTYLAAAKLRAFTPSVLLIRDEASSNLPIVEETIDRHLEWLGRYNIECGVVSRTEVAAGALSQARLAILPYNENVSAGEWAALSNHVATGRQILAYYLLPSHLEKLLGIRSTGWTQGDFKQWVFADPHITGLPDRVDQASWNITRAVPNGMLNSRTIASWYNSQGKSTGHAAWLASDSGLFMSHVLLGDDADRKAYALLCLLAKYLPDLWPSASQGALESIGKFPPFGGFEEAHDRIGKSAALTLRAPFAGAALANASALREVALAAHASADFPGAILKSQSAQRELKRGYSLSLRPMDPEFRGLWEHHATGPFPGNWEAAIDALVTNGFNAIFPNMLWGGLAHYESQVLPRSAEFSQYGDQIAACVTAAKARNVQTHIWKVNWNLEGAPSQFISELRSAQRTQVSSTGQPMDWLCPSHPANFALETNSMLEVVRNYDISGVHFDYIRYPNADYCYCAGCGQRFQAETSRTLTHWPGDVLAAGAVRSAFLDWRREQITRLVRTVSSEAKKLKPGLKVSAAVFPDAASALDDVGQDWRRWIDEGIVDFLCPMNYRKDLSGFTNLVAQQLAYASGRVPIYPGIGAFILESEGVLAQIEGTREAKCGGFVLFELSSGVTTNLFPMLRAGSTAPDEEDTDRDFLPDAWELRYFSDLDTATTQTDFDKDGINESTEYVTGMNPKLSDTGHRLGTVAGTPLLLKLPVLPATGPGYARAERHYSIEGSPEASSGPWEPFSELVDYTASGASAYQIEVAPVMSANRFYRARIWLQERRSSE